MELEQATEVMHFLQDAGYEAELYENYSGRAMYGKTTTGVTTDANPGTMESLEDEMEECEIETGFRHDSMGLDFIYY